MIEKNKFEAFNKICREAKEKGAELVLIYQPEVLSDTYAEVIENLNRLSDANLMLRIIPQEERKPAPR